MAIRESHQEQPAQKEAPQVKELKGWRGRREARWGTAQDVRTSDALDLAQLPPPLAPGLIPKDSEPKWGSYRKLHVIHSTTRT